MKKIIFSAFVLIAFSATSMANDIAEKEVTVLDSVEICAQEQDAAVVETNCDLVKFRIYNIAIDLGYSPQQATSYSYVAYFSCKNKNLTQDYN